MNNKVITIAIGILAFVGAGYAGYRVVSDEELRGKLLREAKDLYKTSKKRVDVVSEDVALKTAMVTNNPKVNQDWVAKQWENAGI